MPARQGGSSQKELGSGVQSLREDDSEDTQFCVQGVGFDEISVATLFVKGIGLRE